MKRTLAILLAAGAVLYIRPVLGQFPNPGAPGSPGATTPSTFPSQGQSRAGQPEPTGTTAPDSFPNKVDDRKFAKDAALGSLTEVELGKLALQKASRDDVKQFGQKMVDEHSKAHDRLKEAATKENISIPDTLDSKRQSRIEKLGKLSGEEFDKAYLKDQVKEDQNQVRDFNDEAQRGSDANVRAFASSMLPALQQQLELARNLSKSGGKSKQR